LIITSKESILKEACKPLLGHNILEVKIKITKLDQEETVVLEATEVQSKLTPSKREMIEKSASKTFIIRICKIHSQ